jgi:hypothetical protein
MSNRFFSFMMIITLFTPTLFASAQGLDATFNPSRIIEDNDMLDVRSLTVAEIQSFLVSKNSYLANYRTTNAYGTINKSAAEIIYDAANNNYDCDGVTLNSLTDETERQQKCRKITTISPKVILATIQKESSLIEEANYNTRLDGYSLGYGCPDSGGCNPRYKGFAKQINSAALQFLAYMNEQNRYPYKSGQTYTFTNPYGTICNEPMTVTVENKATAALYNYTPHVYNGNYNFYRLYKNYFPKGVRNYPDGSLLQVTGEAGVWLIQGGQKRPFTSYSALTSRFDVKKIINISASDLAPYSKGDPIKFPNYSLVQIPNGAIYLLVNNEKRPITSKDIFKKIGFNTEEIISASAEELASYTEGIAITATSTYPTGKLIQEPKSGGVYYVESGYKYPITDKVLLNTKFKGKKISKGTTVELNKYTKGAPVLFGDGELLMSNSVSTVYLISGGQKRAFSSGYVFEKLGYKFSNVITVSPQLLAQYNTGEPIVIQTITE